MTPVLIVGRDFCGCASRDDRSGGTPTCRRAIVAGLGLLLSQQGERSVTRRDDSAVGIPSIYMGRETTRYGTAP